MKEGGNYYLINRMWEAKMAKDQNNYQLPSVWVKFLQENLFRVLVQDLTGKLLQFSERVERFVVTEQP